MKFIQPVNNVTFWKRTKFPKPKLSSMSFSNKSVIVQAIFNMGPYFSDLQYGFIRIARFNLVLPMRYPRYYRKEGFMALETVSIFSAAEFSES